MTNVFCCSWNFVALTTVGSTFINTQKYFCKIYVIIMYSKETGNQHTRMSVEEGPAYCIQGEPTFVLHLFWVSQEGWECRQWGLDLSRGSLSQWTWSSNGMAASLGSELSDTGGAQTDELYFWECQWGTRYSELQGTHLHFLSCSPPTFPPILPFLYLSNSLSSSLPPNPQPVLSHQGLESTWPKS